MPVFVLNLSILLFVLSLFYYLWERRGFPYTIIILIFWIAAGFLIDLFKISWFIDFSLNEDIIFVIFLPILIFSGIININLKHLKFNFKSILNFITFSLLISSSIIGIGIHYLLGLDWVLSLLFGSLISATDPVAVVGIFKSLWAPKRLTTIIEGESLLNDASAVVLFQFLLWFYLDKYEFWINTILGNLFHVIFLSSLLGAIFWYLFFKFTNLVKEDTKLVLISSLLLSEISFITSEYYFEVSGILSTVIAWLIYKILIENNLDSNAEHAKREFWELLEFLGNAFLFFLLWLYVSTLKIENLFNLNVWIFLLILIVARSISIYSVSYFVNKKVEQDQKIPLCWQHILNFWGLRGAIAVAVMFHLNHYISEEISHTLISFVFSSVLFTSLVNTFIVKLLIKRNKLDKYNIDDDLEFIENLILIKEKVFHEIKTSKNKLLVNYKEIYEKKLLELNMDMEQNIKHISEDSILQDALLLQCLSIEQKAFKKYRNQNEIEDKSYVNLHNTTEKQMERIEYHTIDPFLSTNDNLERIQITESRLIAFSHETYLLFLKYFFQELYLEKFIQDLKFKYEIYNSRMKASSEVLNFLNDKENYFFNTLQENKIYKKVLGRYKKFNLNAKNRLEKFKEKYKWEWELFEKVLLQNTLFRKELNTLENLNNKGITKEKVYLWLREELCGQKEKNYKRLKKSFLRTKKI